MSTGEVAPAVPRRLRLVVPHPDGRRVLAAALDLPSLDVMAEVSTLHTAVDAIAGLGLDRVVVDYVIDRSPTAEDDSRIREALVELRPTETVPSPDWHWVDVDALRARVAPGLEAAWTVRLAELRGRAPHPLRAAWSSPGWYDRAARWIEDALVAGGRRAPTEIAQHRHWGISAVMRVEAPDGRTWFKASYPPFGHEGAVTRILAELSDGATPTVLATDDDEAWMLVDDLGPTEVRNAADSQAAIGRLVALQREATGRVDDLLAAGAPERELDRLPATLGEVLAGHVATELVGRPIERLDAIVDTVRDAVAEVAAVGFPSTIAHGDFHPGNVAATGDGIVIFDWTDVCIASPVVDLVTWTWWYTDDPDHQDRVWSWFATAWERELGVDAAALRRPAIETVAYAHHTISYVRLLAGLEPHRRVESVEGVHHFLGLLQAATGGTTS